MTSDKMAKSIMLAFILRFVNPTLGAEDKKTNDFYTGNEYFASNIYKAISELHNGSFVFSPVSLRTTLYLLALGAEGKTQIELSKGAFLPIRPNINFIYLHLSNYINHEDTVNVYHSIYIDKHLVDLKNTYKQIIVSSNINIHHIKNFTELPPDIHKWIPLLTKQNINLTEVVNVMFSSSVFFRRNWKIPITQDEDTLIMTGEFNYFFKADQDMEFVELPFVDSNVTLIIMLPKHPNSKLNTFEPLKYRFTKKRYITIRMPIDFVDLSSKMYFKSALEKSNIHFAFTKDAQFPHISDTPLKIYDVVQETKISVGMEEAGFTSVTVDATRKARSSPYIIEVQRSFMFYFRHNMIGTLAVGRYYVE